MSRSALQLLFVATSAVALFACGSDPTTTGTTGTGGSASTTTSATGTGGSASTSTTTTSTASSSGTGAGVMNACTNMADAAVLAAKDVKAITTMCGQMNVGAEPGTKNCIILNTGLTDNCAGCYSGEVDCISEHCIMAEGHCLTAPDAQPCTDCRNKYCVPAFEACSGVKSM